MRQLYIILFLLLSITTIKAQDENKNIYKSLSSFNNDTLKYLVYNFEENKGLYTGKELNKLIDKLEIKINSCSPFIKSKNKTFNGLALCTIEGKDFKPETNLEDSLGRTKLIVSKKAYVIEIFFEKEIKGKYKNYTANTNIEWEKVTALKCGKIKIKDIKILLKE